MKFVFIQKWNWVMIIHQPMIYDFSKFDFLVFFVFDFLGLYDFFWVVLFCVHDKEDVRSKFMCFLFLILFFFKLIN